jgi:hypothetical protein
MAKKVSRWLLGCGIGCGVLLFVAIGMFGIGAYYYGELSDGFDRAIEMRGELEEQYGGQDDYTPPPDGVPAPERLEAFLAVRESLRDYCQRWEATVGHIDSLDEKEELSAGDLLKVFSSAWGIAPLLSEFSEARNQALLDAGIGLGEYTYLFVLAYYSLAPAKEPEAERPAPQNRRIRAALLEMLRRQAATAVEDPETSRLLEAEIAALEQDPERMLWEEGPPAAVAAAFEPYRQRIRDLACPMASEFELSRYERKGISLHSN